MKKRVLPLIVVAGAGVALAVPSRARACACGCGVFNVGSRWTMPTDSGLALYLQYSFMNQSENWSAFGTSSPSLNADKQIYTHFFTLGARYMFNRAWGLTVKLPVWQRYLRTTSDSGGIVTGQHLSFSDMTVMGLYTGISDDMSTGLEFGLKLPTGPTNLSVFDPDTQPGYGSTSLVLGAYHIGQERGWGWWLQGLMRNALYSYHGYHPGDSYNVSFGAHYDGLIAYDFIPTVTVTASIRGRDGGPQGDSLNTGYQRLLVAPGFELSLGKVSLFADFQIPLLTHTNGQQLVAPWMLSTSVSYAF